MGVKKIMNDRINTNDRVLKTPFSRWNKINRAIHDFTLNEKIKRNGEELNLQKYINENNRDCTIYQVLETYRGDLKLTQARMNVLTHQVSDELMEIKDLRDALTVMKKAEETWKQMPLEIRKEFNNNVSEFQKNGLNWANQKIKEFNALQQAKKQPITKEETNE